MQELADLEKQERELRIEVEKVEGKREYMEEFRRWVEMLGNFLEEKVRALLCDVWQNMTTDLGVVPEIRRN